MTELFDLPAPERLALISELWDSLDEEHVPFSVSQKAELDRRLATLAEDAKKGISWEAVKAELERACP